MSKFTPQPWEFSGTGIWATSPLGARVRIAEITFHAPMNGIDAQANGKLIAAAPDLLAALTSCVEVMQANDMAETYGVIMGRARAAIAKAAGEA